MAEFTEAPSILLLNTVSTGAPDGAQLQIAKGMKDEIVVCPVDSFVRGYLPFSPAVEDVMLGKERLISAGHLSQDSIWEALKATENTIFKHLEEISTSLASVTLPPTSSNTRSETASWIYQFRPNSIIKSSMGGGDYKINGAFCLKPLGGPEFAVSNVAVVVEYKKSTKDAVQLQNRLQILSAANFIMNEDPRRLFTYGITIEDSLVSLWYFSRSHSAKSEPFDFLKDPDLFIKILMAFMFATELSIGFDLKVHRRVSDYKEKSITYVYEFKDIGVDGKSITRYFETQGTISEYRRLRIATRCTRTVGAREVSLSFEPMQNAPMVVLRDVWLNDGSNTEKKTQDLIFEDLEKFGRDLASGRVPPQFTDFDQEMQEEIRELVQTQKYKEYFLTISCESLGLPSKTVVPGFTLDPNLLVLEKKPLTTGRLAVGNNSGYLQPPSYLPQALVQPPNDNHPERQYQPKWPYRLIYKECCADLHSENVASIHDAFSALRDGLTALILLYCAGWVHRDISCGNILLWRDSEGKPHGKLGDLEYAKRFPSNTPGSPDPKTGTAYFMALEVIRGKYRSRDPPVGQGPLPPPVPSSPVQHNFRHDIESLWWLTLWILTCRASPPGTVRDIFTGTTINEPSSSRVYVFEHSGELQDLLQTLPRSLRGLLAHSLEIVRRDLCDGYNAQAVAGRRDVIHTYSGMYKKMRQMLQTKIPADAPPLINGSSGILQPWLPSRATQKRPSTENALQAPPPKKKHI